MEPDAFKIPTPTVWPKEPEPDDESELDDLELGYGDLELIEEAFEEEAKSRVAIDDEGGDEPDFRGVIIV